MNFFLKYLVPCISIAVLALCLLAAYGDAGKESVRLSDAFRGGFPSYFLAKGLFCSTALFLLGKLVQGLGKLKNDNQ
jgi:hypothetical protein